MRLLLLSTPPDQAGSVRISGKDFRYLTRVLRLRVGDRFPVRLPEGTEALVLVRAIDEAGLDGDVTVPEPAPSRSAAILPPVILCQALPKGQKMDLIIRQAVEAGVSRILPFASRHSLPRPDGADRVKLERWNRIVKEARQQSGSAVATELSPPTDTEGLIRWWQEHRSREPGSIAVLLHQDPLAQGTLHGYLSGEIGSVVLVVGPEGGFSAEETSLFMANGFKPVLFGASVLRTETAALYAVAATQVLLLEKKTWILNGSPA